MSATSFIFCYLKDEGGETLGCLLGFSFYCFIIFPNTKYPTGQQGKQVCKGASFVVLVCCPNSKVHQKKN